MKHLKKKYADKEGRELVAVCTRIALETKAEDVMVLDVRGLASFTDYFVIMSGRSTRHVQGVAEAIVGELQTKRINSKSSEGLNEGLWVLLDLGDVVVHIFYHENRGFYNLEGLWHDAPRIDVEALLTVQA
ncbi:ribosome silencing factor [Desulfobulbus oligotrophicus]|jgi:ribosome-associated protein|uniref:Ribosomal silencing factor RsfS n=1 Tax=Desulfobulbus oligotrophicus TaxID=1909699 RepID=A0A7T6AQR3_9BACT|nr:ribosome silencing factor [Desulfobulbus oligotrophicus]MDY0390452.1 ribosome silencing factor [Desulfobulbus oligotrophicus]QQG65812.1 ribosome silencing factor [Desulfobulbus oligotrophicus]